VLLRVLGFSRENQHIIVSLNMLVITKHTIGISVFAEGMMCNNKVKELILLVIFSFDPDLKVKMLIHVTQD